MTREERDTWEAYRAEIQRSTDRIIIPIDIDPATLKRLNAEIDQLYSQVRIDLADMRSQKDKIERSIYVVERKASGSGRNEAGRRANGVEAAEAFTNEDGTVINLYGKEADIIEKYEFVLAIVDILERKSGRLISANGAMKLEANLL